MAVAIILMGLVALIMLRPTPASVVPSPIDTDTSWQPKDADGHVIDADLLMPEVAKLILANRTNFQAAGIDQRSWWKDVNQVYFDQLEKRKADAKAWAATHRVSIEFIGVVHEDTTQTADTDASLVSESQAATYQELIGRLGSVDVILVELHGFEGKVTPDAMVARGMAPSRYHGDDPAGALREALAHSQKAWPRLMMAHPEAPIFCGDEWTLGLDTEILSRFAPIFHDPNAAATPDGAEIRSLESWISFLRSETTIIRAIEHLQAVNGQTAIVTEGALHAEHLRALQSAYKVDVTYVYPGMPDAFISAQHYPR